MKIENQNTSKGSTQPSKFDNMFGRHFTVFAVGILFLITISSFTVLMIFKPEIDDKIITGYFTILGTLAGFFVTKLR